MSRSVTPACLRLHTGLCLVVFAFCCLLYVCWGRRDPIINRQQLIFLAFWTWECRFDFELVGWRVQMGPVKVYAWTKWVLWIYFIRESGANHISILCWWFSWKKCHSKQKTSQWLLGKTFDAHHHWHINSFTHFHLDELEVGSYYLVNVGWSWTNYDDLCPIVVYSCQAGIPLVSSWRPARSWFSSFDAFKVRGNIHSD